MNRPSAMRRLFELRLTPFKIAAIYAILGALWILLSDTLVETVVRDPDLLTHIQTFKGWLYILVTAWLLYVLIRRSATATRRSEETLRVLIDTAPIGIIYYAAPSGGRRIFNKAAEVLMGRSLCEDVSLAEEPAAYGICRPSGEPFPSDELPASRSMRGETCGDVETLIRHPSGREVHLLSSSTPVRDPAGRIIGAIVTLQDITAIRAQERLRDEFVSAAAHELKTPVTTIKGYAQLLRQWAPGGHEPREGEAFKVINTQCDRINRRVQEMLESLRFRAVAPGLYLSHFDLGEPVHQVVQRTRTTNPGRHLLLRDAPLARVEADRERIEEVLVSLLDNAIVFSPQGGDIEVGLSVSEGEAVVTVRDHGVGVPLGRQAHIFEPFYDPVPAGTPGYQGVVALALYLSKLIVERHKGRIWFESEEGRGSTFCFSMPLAGDDDGRGGGRIPA